MKNITIIDYGAGNVKSVSFAFERLGIQPVLSADPKVIKSSDFVVFPGVGHAKFAMDAIKTNNLVELIKNLKQPVLGICLGMQLMCKHTEEGDVEGLGIFDVAVKKFNGDFKIPHMGWNEVISLTPKSLGAEKDSFYFVHSYYVPVCDDTAAICDYNGEFSATLQKDNFYGCQFHPEKSAQAGEHLIKNFLNLSK